MKPCSVRSSFMCLSLQQCIIYAKKSIFRPRQRLDSSAEKGLKAIIINEDTPYPAELWEQLLTTGQIVWTPADSPS